MYANPDTIKAAILKICPPTEVFPYFDTKITRVDAGYQISFIGKFTPDYPGAKEMNRTLAQFSLLQQYNCCGMMVSTNTSVHTPGKKIGQYLQPLKEDIARKAGYSTLMCTVNLNNAAQVHILEKYGWKKVHEFKNRRTDNIVGTFIKELPEVA